MQNPVTGSGLTVSLTHIKSHLQKYRLSLNSAGPRGSKDSDGSGGRHEASLRSSGPLSAGYSGVDPGAYPGVAPPVEDAVDSEAPDYMRLQLAETLAHQCILQEELRQQIQVRKTRGRGEGRRAQRQGSRQGMEGEEWVKGVSCVTVAVPVLRSTASYRLSPPLAPSRSKRS